MEDASTEPSAELEDSRAPFLEHLEELRWRLWRSILGVLFGFFVCLAFSDFLYDFFTAPLYEVLEANKERLGEEPKLVSRTVSGAFMFYFKVALLGGVFIGIPVVLYQMWQFVVPGLYNHEKRFALPFVMISSVCFIGGGLFAYYLVLPTIFDFLINYSIRTGPHKLVPEIAVEDYLGLTTKLLLAFGLVFEMPVVIAFLSWIGLITHRGLLKFFRWAVVLAFILGAALTPPDIISQLFLAGPLIVLYGISIFIAYVITKRNEGVVDEDEEPDDDPDGPDDPDDDSGGHSMGQQGDDPKAETEATETQDADEQAGDSPGAKPDPPGPIGPVFEDDVEPESTRTTEEQVATFQKRQLQMPFKGDKPEEDDVQGGTVSEEGGTEQTSAEDGPSDKESAD